MAINQHFFSQFADVYCKEKKTVINDKIRLLSSKMLIHIHGYSVLKINRPIKNCVAKIKSTQVYYNIYIHHNMSLPYMIPYCRVTCFIYYKMLFMFRWKYRKDTRMCTRFCKQKKLWICFPYDKYNLIPLPLYYISGGFT